MSEKNEATVVNFVTEVPPTPQGSQLSRQKRKNGTAIAMAANVTKQPRKKEEEEGEKREKKAKADAPREAILDMLECLVCLEYPRSRPIYTCSNGHVTCAGCQAKLVVAWKKGTCPKCEDRHIKQDPFVQRLADKTLQGIPTPCQFAQFGCPVKQDIAAIGGHEEQCQYREVHCPAKHRGACQWFGALPKMVAHVREKGCIQIIRTDEPYLPFKSFIGDFSDPSMTVFERRQVTNWKPVLLVSRAIVKYLIYITIQRDATGLWYIQFRTFSPEVVLQRIRVKLQVYRSESTKNEQMFSYEGPVISNTLSNSEMLQEGKYLLLTDAQLKLLRTEETIFEYTVEVMVKPRLNKQAATAEVEKNGITHGSDSSGVSSGTEILY